MSKGWIKLHRQFTEWEWYHDIKTKTLFLHLLLNANHEAKRWKGTLVNRGQLITGIPTLSHETGLSVQSVRTSLMRLEKTGEINRQPNNRFSLITICNYDTFQDNEPTSNRPANRQATCKQHASNNKQELKKEKNLYMCKFATFYEAFPKKRDKQKAERAWQKLKPDDSLFEQIMSALEEQKASADWQREGGKYIPLPSTWLNGRRWEDILDTQQNQDGAGLQLVGGRRVI